LCNNTYTQIEDLEGNQFFGGVNFLNGGQFVTPSFLGSNILKWEVFRGVIFQGLQFFFEDPRRHLDHKCMKIERKFTRGICTPRNAHDTFSQITTGEVFKGKASVVCVTFSVTTSVIVSSPRPSVAGSRILKIVQTATGGVTSRGSLIQPSPAEVDQLRILMCDAPYIPLTTTSKLLL
jgi:hypothetical protein